MRARREATGQATAQTGRRGDADRYEDFWREESTEIEPLVEQLRTLLVTLSAVGAEVLRVEMRADQERPGYVEVAFLITEAQARALDYSEARVATLLLGAEPAPPDPLSS